MVDRLNYNVSSLRNKVEKWIFNQGYGKYYERLAVVRIAELLYPRETKLIREGVCPWCGRKFAVYSSIKLHLARAGLPTKCKMEFLNMINHILQTYIDFLSVLKYDSSWKSSRYKLRDREGNVYVFKHISEAAEFYVKKLTMITAKATMASVV